MATHSAPPSLLATICRCSPVPGTPDISLAWLTSMGTRRTGDGHPMTVTHHPIGMTGKTTKDLWTASERAGTG